MIFLSQFPIKYGMWYKFNLLHKNKKSWSFRLIFSSRISTLIIILWIVNSFTSSHASINKFQNLLSNPGFEKGKKFWLGSGNVRGIEKLSGRKSLAIMGKRTHNLRVHQTILVKPGSTYHFIGWKKVVNTSRGKYRFRISWFNKYGKEINSSRGYFGEGSSGLAFVKYTAIYTAPEKAIKAKLFLEAIFANGIGYFDDISITAVDGKKIKTSIVAYTKMHKEKQKNQKLMVKIKNKRKKYNNKLIANDDYFVVKQNKKSTINLLVNDVGITKSTEVKVLIPPKQGKIILINSGKVQYQPNKDFFGEDDFIYQLIDGEGNKYFANASIKIQCASKCQQSFSLSWQESQSRDIVGYKVYVGRTLNKFDQMFTVKNTTKFKYIASQKGDYYFAIKAFNHNKLESDYSGIVRGVF